MQSDVPRGKTDVRLGDAAAEGAGRTLRPGNAARRGGVRLPDRGAAGPARRAGGDGEHRLPAAGPAGRRGSSARADGAVAGRAAAALLPADGRGPPSAGGDGPPLGSASRLGQPTARRRESMTTAMRTELDAPLRALVERRLDGIDRVLLAAGVSRGERCGIVEEVEAQIYEMLARRADGPPTRQDVLAVLAALDPPEAYAPEGYRAVLEEE